jgi:hypothetical protein
LIADVESQPGGCCRAEGDVLGSEGGPVSVTDVQVDGCGKGGRLEALGAQGDSLWPGCVMLGGAAERMPWCARRRAEPVHGG